MATPRQRGLIKSHPDDKFLQQMNGQANGHLGAPGRNGPLSASTNISLPGVDAEKLKARLYSYAPQQAPVNPRALRFIRPTNAQLKRAAVPSAPRLEPLVSVRFSVL